MSKKKKILIGVGAIILLIAVLAIAFGGGKQIGVVESGDGWNMAFIVDDSQTAVLHYGYNGKGEQFWVIMKTKDGFGSIGSTFDIALVYEPKSEEKVAIAGTGRVVNKRSILGLYGDRLNTGIKEAAIKEVDKINFIFKDGETYTFNNFNEFAKLIKKEDKAFY